MVARGGTEVARGETRMGEGDTGAGRPPWDSGVAERRSAGLPKGLAGSCMWASSAVESDMRSRDEVDEELAKASRGEGAEDGEDEEAAEAAS